MSQAYASEKRALGICDRCGLSFKLKTLKWEIVNLNETGLRVCTKCWDKDHPQLQLGRYRFDDPQALQNARPDTGERASASLSGWRPIASILAPGETGQITGE